MTGPGSPDGAPRRRPGRFWYWIAGAIVLLGLLAAVASAAYAGQSAGRLSREVQRLDPQLRPVPIGVPAPVSLEAGADWAVYVASSGPVPRVSCGGDGLAVSAVQDDVTTTRDGVTWHEALAVRAREPGRYSIVCTATDRTVRLAVGRAVDPAAADRVTGGAVRALLGLLATFAFAGLGVLAGGAIALVVALRRRQA